MNNLVSMHELTSRWDRYRNLLQRHVPQAQGAFIFSRLNIYYFTGTFANGVLWLPLSGDPVLLCRRGVERSKIESPIRHIYSFKSYSEIEPMLIDLGFSLPQYIAAEMNGLSWALANSLTKYLAAHQFLPADKILGMSRAKKSDWELTILREAGSKHARCLTELLPPMLHDGISELEIGHKISDLFLAEGHHGILRMENYGEEVFLGHISVGDSANYPSVFNGPVGLRGVHPATPYMGSADVKWTKGTPLTIDNGFTLAGYITDKTQVYWLGDKETIPAHVREAHAFCMRLQDQIIALLRPGMQPSEVWNQCMLNVESSKWRDGFMGLGENKVSFVGHGIGLAIDEYPVVTKGFDVPLEEGVVLAIEPKIGIPGFGMVGVENTFEVTTRGGKSLTGNNFDIISIS